MGTHYGAGSTILLTYWSAGSILINGTASATDRWVGNDRDNNTIGEYAGACTAGPFGMARYSLILQVDESHWESLVSTSSTGTSKVKNTNGFLLTTILHQDAGTYASGVNAGQSGVWYTKSTFDTRYSTNGGQFSAAGKPFYLVGTIIDNKFYLKDTTWWANELPTEDDGNVYWYVGQFYNAYACTLSPIHPIYDYIDGEWRKIVEYSRNAVTVNGHTVNADVPSDAVFTDTTYTFDTGDSNGQIKVTPSGGTAQNVSVKGLASAAYVDTESSVANDAKVPTGAAVKSFVEGKGYTTNAGTVTSVSGATGLTGTVTGTGSIKADLVSETKLTNAAVAATETANRVYPVALDTNGKLAVNVPWTESSAAVSGVKGNAESSYRTGNVNITPANIGLENVNNTSDANKPISTATQTALDAKADKTDLENSKIHLVMGTQTETTKDWTGEIDVDELYDGLTILYYLPRTSASNVTLNLTLADGTTKTGAKEVYVTNSTRMGTHYGAGATILLTYWSAGSILINGTATATDRWTGADYWNSNTIGEYAGACTAGSFGMARYSLIAQVDETHWESLVATSGSETSKAMNTHGFMLTTMFYQSGGNIASGSNSANGSTWLTGSFDTRYSTNGGSFSAAGRPFYLVGTISGGKFYLKPTTWWADSLPSTNDGYVYWYVGIMYSTYQCTLTSEHPIYQWIRNGWHEVSDLTLDLLARVSALEAALQA